MRLIKRLHEGCSYWEHPWKKDAVSKEIDQADADAAFRAAVTEVCRQHGMNITQNCVMFIRRKLTELESSPDIQMVGALAEVLERNGIPDGEDPVHFISAKLREANDLSEELADVQHKLADYVAKEEDSQRYSGGADVVEEIMNTDYLAGKIKNLFDYVERRENSLTNYLSELHNKKVKQSEGNALSLSSKITTCFFFTAVASPIVYFLTGLAVNYFTK